MDFLTFKIGASTLQTEITKNPDHTLLIFKSPLTSLTLHWGLGIKSHLEWLNPFKTDLLLTKEKTKTFDDKACQSEFELKDKLSFLAIKLKSLPKQINFVLKSGNTWFNNSGKNYAIKFEENNIQNNENVYVEYDINSFCREIVEIENSDRSWTLMHRFNLCHDYLQKTDDIDALAYFLVWMRYSSLGKLTWQRKYNTKPSELAYNQKRLSLFIAGLIKKSDNNGLITKNFILKNILACVGRGGDNGQRIRDQILEIMHRCHMRENNSFYEQWHQKLHNNTTPDDIGICEAIIEFLKTKNLQDYYKTLEKHCITESRLKSFERPITMQPFFVDNLEGDLKDYLILLKSVHECKDLNISIDKCKGFLPPKIKEELILLQNNLHHWDKMKQINMSVNLKKVISQQNFNFDIEKTREVIFLEIGLDEYIRKSCEEIIHIELEFAQLGQELLLLIENACLNFPKYEELINSTLDFKEFLSFLKNTDKKEKEDYQILKASVDRLKRFLGRFVDDFTELIDDKAILLGSSLKIEENYIKIFSEELIRGSFMFTISMVLKKLDRKLNEIIGFKTWSIISSKNNIKGKLIKRNELNSIENFDQKEKNILICQKIRGEDDIPKGIVAIITESDLDVLAHICIRARNLGVLLAVCYDKNEMQKIETLTNNYIQMDIFSGNLQISKSTYIENAEEERKELQLNNNIVKNIAISPKIFINECEFNESIVGSKANNCGKLKRIIGEKLNIPSSHALPFGTCEKIIDLPINSSIKQKITNLIESITRNPNDLKSLKLNLNELKSLTLQLELDNSLRSSLSESLSQIDCKNFDKAWLTIKKVWASKYNERAYSNLIKVGIPLTSIKMSVLCQKVIQGDFSFVLHTINPINNDKSQIYGEIVFGFGEALVNLNEGRALSFIIDKKTEKIEIVTFPNKSEAIFVEEGFIFRSDSNCEDLDQFAGAGLFDSFPLESSRTENLLYFGNKLVVDQMYRNKLILKLKEVGLVVEQCFNGVPQDIEGVVKGDIPYVVQSRTQIVLS